jgi:hypothetical protein
MLVSESKLSITACKFAVAMPRRGQRLAHVARGQ